MGMFDNFTGKAVEQKISKYTEVYGEVLLGMHKELETQKREAASTHRSLVGEQEESRTRILKLEEDLGQLGDRLETVSKQWGSIDARLAQVKVGLSLLHQTDSSIAELRRDAERLREDARNASAAHQRKFRALWIAWGFLLIACGGFALALWLAS